MRKSIQFFMLIFLTIFFFNAAGGAETLVLKYKNPVDWMNNQLKPVNGEKILYNFISLETIINTNALNTNSDSVNKNARILNIENDSIVKNTRLNILEYFKNTIGETFYTISLMNFFLNNKSDTAHTHDTLYLSKTNTDTYFPDPTKHYQPATVKYVNDKVINAGAFDTDSIINLILTTVEPDSVSKDSRILNIANNLNYTNFNVGVLQNENVLQTFKISRLESDSAQQNTRLNNLEIFKDTANDSFLRKDIEDTATKLNILYDLKVDSGFAVDGAITLGKDDGFGNKPDLILNCNIKSSLIPRANNMNLGDAGNRWHNAYIDSMIVTTLGADSVEISGTLLNNFTINSGNGNPADSPSLTFYQADSLQAHGVLSYEQGAQDFLFNKPLRINGNISNSGNITTTGSFNGSAAGLLIDTNITIKNYIDTLSANIMAKFNQVAIDTTQLKNRIDNLKTDTADWNNVTNKPFIPDTAPYLLKNNVDTPTQYNQAANKGYIDSMALNIGIHFNPLFPSTGGGVRHPLIYNGIRLDAVDSYVINLADSFNIPDNAKGVILSYEFITPDTITSYPLYNDAILFRRGDFCTWSMYDIVLPYKLYTGNENNNYGIFLFNYTHSGQIFLPIENKKFSIRVYMYWAIVVLRYMGWF